VPALLRANHCTRIALFAFSAREIFKGGDYTTYPLDRFKSVGSVWAMLFPDGRKMDAFHRYLSNRLHSFDCAPTVREKSRPWGKTRRFQKLSFSPISR